MLSQEITEQITNTIQTCNIHKKRMENAVQYLKDKFPGKFLLESDL